MHKDGVRSVVCIALRIISQFKPRVSNRNRMMLINARTGHGLRCGKGKYLFIQETCFGIIPKAFFCQAVEFIHFL
jgi:hypothetical protein